MKLANQLLIAGLIAGTQSSAFAGDVANLSLEDLLKVQIIGASKYKQKQSEVAAAISVITRHEIKAFGWRTLDEALASLPGVHTTYDRQYSYQGLRGFGLPGDFNTRLLVTINGNRTNDPGYDGGPLGRQFPLDMDLIERVEFIPGPGGAVYGQNAMFGVVNVITRTGASVNGAELTAAYQRPEAMREGRLTWGKRLENGVDVLASVSGMRARGEDRFFTYGTTGISGVAAGLDRERDRELFASVTGGTWALDIVSGDRRKDDPAAGYFSDPLVPGQYQGDRYRLAQLRFQDQFAAGTLDVSGRLFFGQLHYTSILSYGAPFSFPEPSDWRGAELRLLSSAWTGHKLMIGLELQDNVRSTQYVTDLSNRADEIVIPRPGYRVGLYAQDEWQVSAALAATVGLRLDRNNITGNKSSPRAALIWQAAPSTVVKALYGRANRPPNAFERDYYDGVSQVANPALNGESIDTLELVADHRVGRDLSLRGSAYQWTMRDLVTLGIDAASGLSQYQSGEKVTAHGLELSADKTWSSGARLRGSLSRQEVKYASGAALVNSPKVLGKINLSTPLPFAGLTMGYEWRYDSRRLTNEGSHLGGYALSNLHLSTELLEKKLELSVGIFNLCNKRYAQPAADSNWQNALDQDGRQLRLKVLYAF